MNYDVAIIGGGAAGLFAAVMLKQKNSALNIVVLESLDRVGKKLITTGNGRCNITNRFADVSRYHGADRAFIQSVFDKFFIDDTARVFSSVGVEIVFEEDGRAYPASYQASSVVDALRFFCEENGVVIKTDSAVTDIIFNDGYTVKTPTQAVFAKALLVTGGLLSGGKKVGSDGSVLAIVKRLGIKCAPVAPAIVQLKTNTDLCRQLKGIKVNCNVTLGSRTEYGELLFTEYGLSGPPVLQVSRGAAVGQSVYADLLPHMSRDKLLSLLEYRKNILKNRTLENYLTGFLNKRVGQVVIKDCGLKLSDSVADLSKADISAIASKIKALEFKVTGNTGFINSQVSCGGVRHSELSQSLESKKYKNMFFAGEIIDVDGDCGGFNLQWAWSSAAVASEGIVKCL